MDPAFGVQAWESYVLEAMQSPHPHLQYPTAHQASLSPLLVLSTPRHFLVVLMALLWSH